MEWSWAEGSSGWLSPIFNLYMKANRWNDFVIFGKSPIISVAFFSLFRKPSPLGIRPKPVTISWFKTKMSPFPTKKRRDSRRGNTTLSAVHLRTKGVVQIGVTQRQIARGITFTFNINPTSASHCFSKSVMARSSQPSSSSAGLMTPGRSFRWPWWTATLAFALAQIER